MAITPLPTLDRTSPSFRSAVDTLFGSQLPAFAAEANALEINVNAKEVTASAAAVTATTQAGISTTGASTATTKAGEAVTSASNADAARVLAQAAAASITAQVSVATNSATSKSTPVDADEIPITDSATGFVLKKLTWANLRAMFIASSIPNTPAGNIAATNVQAAINELDTEKADKLIATLGCFIKADTQSVVFTKTAVGAVSLKAGTYVDVAGVLMTFSIATAVTMPALTAGTDYAIYACTDGSLRADASFSAPTGYTTANSRKIGGFHYAPGGNAAAQAGGDTTPQINEYSFWDLKFKPSSPDPRGQMVVAGAFFADIYPLGVDHITNGTSKYNVTIADGSSPPKVPMQFGGNGSTAYTTLTQFEAAEVMAAYGKRLPTYAEFSALAYGTTEATSGSTDPVSTILRAPFTSKWGAILASGNMWFWGSNFGGGAAAASWATNTAGRGSTNQMENAAIFGGSWVEASNAGSRASGWGTSPTGSVNSFGARGVCDLLILE